LWCIFPHSRDGDQYAALRDCYAAIQLDPDHLKAQFRLAKCLFELEWLTEAAESLEYFKTKFPDYSTSDACIALEKDLKAAMNCSTQKGGLFVVFTHFLLHNFSAAEKGARRSSKNGHSKPRDSLSEQEATWQSSASDYNLRFCGHCNTTTDIKEANFFGRSVLHTNFRKAMKIHLFHYV
jgi:WD and tetratricopeptide repeat-containing protein 1